MTHGSLFSGIGGFDLAAEWMGWENVFHCEWNPFGQRVLKYYWPNSISYNDITQTDFTIHRGKIDIITGGFPCQPYSSAGKRLGKEDERHLWPEMLRCIREVKPRWVVGENVLGLVNWSGGLVFQEVQADLEAQGYEVQPYVLPAAAVNAPHRRDRVWFVAHAIGSSDRANELRGIRSKNGEIDTKGTQTIYNAVGSDGVEGIITDTGSSGLQTNDTLRESEREINITRDYGENVFTNTNGIGLWRESNWFRKSKFFSKNNKRNDWQNFPTVSPICTGDDGFSSRLDGITFPKWRNESIKAGGNAIVPQVVYQIFKAIQEYERITTTKQDH